jgi:uncharacterized protein YdaU (DUF1376 family)
MKKSTYYFSHDYNAANDVKILFMRQQLGMEGYGIYWYLIEHLADAGGRLPLKIIPVLAMQMQSQEIKIRAVISEFELFEIVDDTFFSIRLLNNLDRVNDLKINNSIKGKLSAEKRKSTAVEQRLNSGATKERKGKEIKGNEIHNVFSDNFLVHWQNWIDYKKTSHKFVYKTEVSLKISFENLVRLSANNEQNAIEIINQSIANGWKGFFELKTTQNANRIESVVNWANQFQ